MTDCSRRAFLASSSAVAAAAFSDTTLAGSGALDSPSSGNQLKLSLAAYSFHRQMARRGTPSQIAAATMTLEKFIDFCAEQELAAAELTSYYFPRQVTPEYLVSLKQRTHRLGISISGTAIGNDFCVIEGSARDKQLEDCRRWIDYAAIMGAPAIRIFAGKVPKGETEAAAITRCAAGINESLQYAAKKGVFLALENHGGITSTPEQMFRIIEQVEESPWFGINLDSGNFRTADPYGDLEKIAPLAVNAQIKVMMNRDGHKEPADINRIISILKSVGYRGFIALEYESQADPWTEIPRYLDQLRTAIG